MEGETFLVRVRSAAAGGHVPLAGVIEAEPSATEVSASDLMADFITNLEATGGEVHLPATEAGAIAMVVDVAEHNRGRFLAWDESQLPLPGLPEAIAQAGLERMSANVPEDPEARLDHQAGYSAVQVGVTGATAGLAESGSIVLEAGPGRPRMASLIPLAHIALLDRRSVFASLSHWMAQDPGAVTRTSNLIVITGPSRTADIEQSLTLGVHGPRYLHVVLLPETSEAG